MTKLEERVNQDRYGNIYGTLSPTAYEMYIKINEMIDVIDSLNKRISELEKTLNNVHEINK